MAIKLGQNKSCFLSGATISSTKEGVGVKLDSTIFRVVLATAGSQNIGIITDNGTYAINDTINIAADAGDIVQVLAGGVGFSIGDNLKTDSNGAWVTASVGDASFAVALQNATSGQLGWAIIQPMLGGQTGPTGYTGYTH